MVSIQCQHVIENEVGEQAAEKVSAARAEVLFKCRCRSRRNPQLLVEVDHRREDKRRQQATRKRTPFSFTIANVVSKAAGPKSAKAKTAKCPCGEAFEIPPLHSKLPPQKDSVPKSFPDRNDCNTCPDRNSGGHSYRHSDRNPDE